MKCLGDVCLIVFEFFRKSVDGGHWERNYIDVVTRQGEVIELDVTPRYHDLANHPSERNLRERMLGGVCNFTTSDIYISDDETGYG